MDVFEIAISDTIGAATPGDVGAVLHATRDVLPLHQTALHFHDTRGLGLANVLAALDAAEPGLVDLADRVRGIAPDVAAAPADVRRARRMACCAEPLETRRFLARFEH